MKKIVLSMVVVAIAAVTTLNVNFNSKSSSDELSLLSLANVEALAQENNGDDRSRCSTEWYANVMGQMVKLSCSADCASGQKAECKQNSCKCV